MREGRPPVTFESGFHAALILQRWIEVAAPDAHVRREDRRPKAALRRHAGRASRLLRNEKAR
jgi:hypothetical protein